MSLLVDSSIWIAAANLKNKECWQLKNLIKQNVDIRICRPIQMEVCQGVKSERDFNLLWDSFLGFSFLTIDDELWEKSAWNYFKCRKRGITTSSLDSLIATLAVANRMPLWTADKDFSLMAPILGLELYQYHSPP